MKKELDFSRYVDRYLDGVMSIEERVWFEKELQGNNELHLEIELQKSLNTMLENREVLELHGQLNDIHEQYFGERKRVLNLDRKFKRVLYVSTAAVVSLTMTVFMLTHGIKHTSGTELYAQYFKPAEINMSFRAGSSVGDHELRSAMLLYENKNYEEAVKLFEKILSKDNSRIGLNLYSGISHMEVKEYSEANKRFEKIIDHKANAFVESAEWYLGLCYLKMNDEQKAKNIFADIANSESYYNKEAKSILRKME